MSFHNQSKIFIDCGSNMGMGFCELSKSLNIDESWKVFAFEPNIYSYREYIKNIESDRFDCLKKKNITIRNLAVWDENCSLQFCMEKVSKTAYENDPSWRDVCDKINSGYKEGKNLDFIDFNLPATGGSCVKIFRDNLKRPPDHEIKLEFESEVSVSAINLSQWILNNFDEEDYIILKMDIEGSEYKVLPKMILDNSIKLIDKLYIEWHDWQLPEYRNQTSLLLNKLNDLGVEVINWY